MKSINDKHTRDALVKLKSFHSDYILPVVMSYHNYEIHTWNQQQLEISKGHIIHYISKQKRVELYTKDITGIWWKYEDGIYSVGVMNIFNNNSYYICTENPHDFIELTHQLLDVQLIEWSLFNSPPSDFQLERIELIHSLDVINSQSSTQSLHLSDSLENSPSQHKTLKKEKFHFSFVKQKKKKTDVVPEIEITNIEDSSEPAHESVSIVSLSSDKKLTTTLSQNNQSTESTEVFRYEGISITVGDISRIQDEMINDTIIEFYMKYLQNIIPTTECSSKWIKVDFSQMKFVFIPIHQGSDTSGHWTLYVLCCKGLNTETLKKLRRPKPNYFFESPCILCLDSMSKKPIPNATNKLRSLVSNKLNGIPISSKTMPFYMVHVPKQNNCVDCGVYVLYFIDKIYRDQPISLYDMENLFSTKDALMFRNQIKGSIKDARSD
ncbi:Ulp1 protease family [Entamoeba marina]